MMNPASTFVKLIICLFLLGFGQPVFSAVKSKTQDLEALWKHYLETDAGKIPTTQFPYEGCFKSAAQKHDLPLSLLLAVARGESNFNPNAKSDRNCHGLMQIQWPVTAKYLGIYRLSALYDPCTNINAGARYLKELLDRYDNNLHLALAAYNYGPNRIDKSPVSSQIPAGAKWYSGYIFRHLVYVLGDGTGSARLYLNGAEIAPGNYTGGAVAGNTERLAIGHSDSDFDFDGFIDEVQISDTDRSADWIAAQYLATKNQFGVEFVKFGIEESAPEGADLTSWRY